MCWRKNANGHRPTLIRLCNVINSTLNENIYNKINYNSYVNSIYRDFYFRVPLIAFIIILFTSLDDFVV